MCAAPVAAGSSLPLGEDVRATLLRMLRAMFPHPSFPQGPYERAVDGLLADATQCPGLAGVLVQGSRDLDLLAGCPFVELDQDRALALLREISGSRFFVDVRARALAVLYDDPDVTALLGYEGPAFEKGGYLRRGFDDLDWLPEPPL